MSFSIQALFVRLGVLESGAIHVPAWIPDFGLRFAVILLIIVGFFRAIGQGLSGFFIGAVTENFKSLQRSRLTQFVFGSEKVSSGAIVSLMTETNQQAAAFVGYLQMVTFQFTVSLFLGFALLGISFQTTLFAGALLALVALPMRQLDRRLGLIGQTLLKQSESATHRLMMSIRNLLLMQIYGTQSEEERFTQTAFENYRKSYVQSWVLNGLKAGIPQVVGVLIIGALAFTTKKSWGLERGVFITYVYLFSRFVQSFAEFVRSVALLAIYRPYFSRIHEWYQKVYVGAFEENRKIDWAKVPQATSAKPFPAPVGWVLKNLSFSYPVTGERSSKQLIRDLTLEIRAAEFFVIYGPSGSGKSTLLSLLLGVQEAQSGSLLIRTGDGSEHSFKGVRAQLLASMGYVGPESFIVDGTLRENLLYGLHGSAITDEEMHLALGRAECDFVRDLPGGLSYRLTEQGQGLSAGQKQRLGLARALIRKPKVLILDEATSNLDEEVESRLIQSLVALRGEMTVVAVTHRPALKRVADRIMEMSTGRVEASI